MTERKAIPHLLDEPPISVYPSLAVALGNVNKAIILQQLHFLLNIAKQSKNEYVHIDDKWWVYNSYKEWRKYFPWLAEVTIKGLFGMLEADGLVISRQGVKDKLDRRKWYTIDYDSYLTYISSIGQKVSDEHEIENIPSDGQKVSDVIKESETSSSKIKNSPKPPKGAKSKSSNPSKPLRYPSNRIQWTAEHYRQYGNEHPVVNALAALDSDDLKPTLSQLVKVVASDCVELFEELERFAVSPDDYSDLLAYTLKHSKRKEYSIFKRMTYCLNTWLKGEEESADPYAHLPDIDYGAEMARMGITEIIR